MSVASGGASGALAPIATVQTPACTTGSKFVACQVETQAWPAPAAALACGSPTHPRCRPAATSTQPKILPQHAQLHAHLLAGDAPLPLAALRMVVCIMSSSGQRTSYQPWSLTRMELTWQPATRAGGWCCLSRLLCSRCVGAGAGAKLPCSVPVACLRLPSCGMGVDQNLTSAVLRHSATRPPQTAAAFLRCMRKTPAAGPLTTSNPQPPHAALHAPCSHA